MNQMLQWSKKRVSSLGNQRGVTEAAQESAATHKHTKTKTQTEQELWKGLHTDMYNARLRFPLLPSERSWQSWNKVPGDPSAATTVKLKLRPPNTLFPYCRTKVQESCRSKFQLASRLPTPVRVRAGLSYLHNKSWSQEVSVLRPWCFLCIHFFFSITYHFSSIRADNWYSDLFLHTPWQIGLGITSVPVRGFPPGRCTRKSEWVGGRRFFCGLLPNIAVKKLPLHTFFFYELRITQGAVTSPPYVLFAP